MSKTKILDDCSQPKTVQEFINHLNLPSRMMDEKEVAAFVHCSIQTLRNDRHLGRGLPYHKYGRRVRYSPYDVAAKIMKNRIDPEARR